MTDRNLTIYRACWTGLTQLQAEIFAAVDANNLWLAELLIGRIDSWPEAQLHLLAGELPCALCGEWAPEAGPCPECGGDPTAERLACEACGGDGGSMDTRAGTSLWTRCPHECDAGQVPAPHLEQRELWRQRLRLAAPRSSLCGACGTVYDPTANVHACAASPRA